MSVSEKERIYIIDDIVISLPEEKCEELMGGFHPGFVYDPDYPSETHQRFVSRLNTYIGAHIAEAGRDCEVFLTPFAVFLDADNYIEPDLSVVCNKNRLSDRGCEGAPDWVIEITSLSTQNDDYMTKLFQYRSIGVRLYWVVDPEKQTVNVWDFEREGYAQYSFSDPIPVSIWEGFVMHMDDIM